MKQRGGIVKLTNLKSLYTELADVFDGHRAIEKQARRALLAADVSQVSDEGAIKLTQPFLQVLADANAHPVCRLISTMSFPWAPPQTSSDPLYIQDSLPKVHVELLGPDGLVKSDKVRLGLYGMLPDAEYGIRTHPAEELFVMLAGQVFWKRGADSYQLHGPYDHSYHPPMMEHANRTGDVAFMSVYVWHGDLATDDYVYTGAPES